MLALPIIRFDVGLGGGGALFKGKGKKLRCVSVIGTEGSLRGRPNEKKKKISKGKAEKRRLK